MFNWRGNAFPLLIFITMEWLFSLLSFFGSLITNGLGIGANADSVAQTNIQNAINNSMANATNLKISRETNAANIQQADLAYQRSLPVNQVRNLMNAGMSKAAALNSLSGGGTYTAPALTSQPVSPFVNQAFQGNYGSLAQSFERLANIPGNVEQHRLVQEQRELLAMQTKIAEQRELRERENHEYDKWLKLYGKDATIKLDSMTQKIVSLAADKNINLDDIDSIDKLRKAFNLDNDKDWRSLPAGARSQILLSLRSQGAENRANANELRQEREQKNRDNAAKDAHAKHIDDLLNSEFSRTLTHQQITKLKAETEKAWQDVDAYENARDAVEQENIARAARARFEAVMSEFGISKHELESSSFWTKDKNGNYVPKGIGDTKSQIANAWKMVGAFFGVDLLSDIVRGIVAVSPK